MAVGIGLVFGVLRLVNFAYGQLVMAGAYTLAYTSDWPVGLEHRRLLRRRDRALARDGAHGLPAAARAVADGHARDHVRDLVRAAERSRCSSTSATTRSASPRPRSRRSTSSIDVLGVDVRKVTIVAVARRARARSARSRCCSAAPSIGLRTRAAAADFRTARMLGVKANQVIGLAVVLSGALAAAVAVILTVQTPFVTPDFALHDTIIVLVGVVVGGIDRLWTATLGGFAIGFTSGIVNGALPTDSTIYLPSRRDGARDPRAAAAPGRAVRARPLLRGRPRMRQPRRDRGARPDAARRPRRAASARRSRAANEQYFLSAIISVAMVVAIYVFVGNSGVLSFGQISFVAVGGFASGVMTIPVESKSGVLPGALPDPARPHGRQWCPRSCSRRSSAACSRSCSACR